MGRSWREFLDPAHKTLLMLLAAEISLTAECLTLVSAVASQVIHCAGPFQRSESTAVLDACIETKTAYIDVCDDMEHSDLTKALHSKAQEAGVPCITTAGADSVVCCHISRITDGNVGTVQLFAAGTVMISDHHIAHTSSMHS